MFCSFSSTTSTLCCLLYFIYIVFLIKIRGSVCQATSIPSDCDNCLSDPGMVWCGRNITLAGGKCIRKDEVCDAPFKYDLFCPTGLVDLLSLDYKETRWTVDNGFEFRVCESLPTVINANILIGVAPMIVSTDITFNLQAHQNGMNRSLVSGWMVSLNDSEKWIFELNLEKLYLYWNPNGCITFELTLTSIRQVSTASPSSSTPPTPSPAPSPTFSIDIISVKANLMTTDMNIDYKNSSPLIRVSSDPYVTVDPFILKEYDRLGYVCSIDGYSTNPLCFSKCYFPTETLPLDKLPLNVSLIMSYQRDIFTNFVPYPLEHWLYQYPVLKNASDRGVNVDLFGEYFWQYKENSTMPKIVVRLQRMLDPGQAHRFIEPTYINSQHLSIEITTMSNTTINTGVDGEFTLCLAIEYNGNVYTDFDIVAPPYCTNVVISINPRNLLLIVVFVLTGVGVSVGCTYAMLVLGTCAFLKKRNDNQKYLAVIPEDIEFDLTLREKDLTYLEQLGEGSYGIVFHGKLKEFDVAIKSMKGTSPEISEDFMKEISVMCKLRHPNIVLMIGLVNEPQRLCIVTEFMSHGSLASIIRDKRWIVENEHVRKMARDTCQGLSYLHGHSIIHRDLKCSNLLVDKDWNVKVGDFGISRKTDNDNRSMTVCGSPAWVAPEVITTHHYSTKADVYSFGVCLWEMTARKIPYSELHPNQIIIEVTVNGRRPTVESNVLPAFLDIMDRCWATSPESRPTFDELVSSFNSLSLARPVNSHPVMKTEVELSFE